VKKQKIAILGGGIGALTTAFELTNDKEWKNRYESITVYQMGWRLGGKGASGRNQDHSNRIQEHGLHVFMGFYDNAFHMMEALYDECRNKNLTPNSPFSNVKDAFSPLSTIVLTEMVAGKWELWPQQWKENPDSPGFTGPKASDVKPFVVQLALMAADKVTEALPLPGPLRTTLLKIAQMLAKDGITSAIAKAVVDVTNGLSSFLHQTLHLPALAEGVHGVARGAFQFAGGEGSNDAPAYDAQLSNVQAKGHALVDKYDRGEGLQDDEVQGMVEDVDRLGRVLFPALRAAVGLLDTETRRRLIVADLCLTVARGMLADGLLDGDFEKVEDMDLADWLKKHGSLFDGRDPLTLGLYDAMFAYEDGNPKKPRLGAGTGLYAGIRLAFTYRGAIMWRMAAGMGDTIFTPLYKVLKSRGVTFEFFQKVTNLGLSADKKNIDTVDIDVQAEVKPERKDSFCPLVKVPTTIQGQARSLSCWPDRPKYDDLVQGEEMKQASLVNPDIESYWTDWKPTPEIKRQLRAGKDFDIIVLGISLGALPFIARELIAQDGTPQTTPNFEALSKWRNMLDNIKTVRTQGLQLWLDDTAGDMGFQLPQQFTDKPLLCSFVEPFDTWCDMTHLIPAENFASPPKQIAYFCNAAPADPTPPDFSNHSYPELQKQKALSGVSQFLDQNAKTIWNKCMDPSNPQKFDRRRVREDFFRLNVDPPEQYILSVPGSRSARLKPGESLFDNLVLAGDWTRSIMDLGCAEGAVISGKLAAAKILEGDPTVKKPQIFGGIGAKWEEI
jgi:uncharacterized protein with NAD-binding domain and iron-sulfur cluster